MDRNKRIIAIIAARMDSNRFPGKMTHDLRGDPLLGFVIERAKNVKNVEIILVATSSRPIDDPIAQIAHSYGASVYRGDMVIDNVALRFLNCAKNYHASYFVRINGDSPCVDAKLIEKGISYCQEDYDIITNIPSRTFPYGISLEIIKTSILETVYPLFSQYDREHITSYFYRNHTCFSIKEIVNTLSIRAIKKFAVDTLEDLDELNDFFQNNKNRSWHDFQESIV